MVGLAAAPYRIVATILGFIFIGLSALFARERSIASARRLFLFSIPYYRCCVGRPRRRSSVDLNITVLPHLNALLNATSAVFLITGYVLIRNGHEVAHKRSMIAALICSAAFLTSYVIYHLHAGSSVPRNRRDTWHILRNPDCVVLAAVILPLVLMTATRGLRSQFDRHVRIARWTLPLWLYVSVTGVIVYLMLYQLY